MNSQTADLPGPERAPENGQLPKKLVVFLHGLGADGNDLIDISAYWAGTLPDTHFVAPDAPEPCDMAPVGRQWFSLIDRTAQAMMAGAETAAPILNAYLDGLLAHHDLDDGKMALVGFSQGGMMALHAGLRRPHPCAGIACFSSMLVGADRISSDIRARPPVLLVHGDNDEVVPAAAMPMTEKALVGANVSVESHLRPGLGHGIDGHAIELGGAFLKRVLEQAA
jgi:phospholipase/carboxylesterase